MLAFPVFFPMAAACACYIAGRHSKGLRDVLVILTCLLEFACAVCLLLAVSAGAQLTFSMPVCLMGLNLKLDGFRALYMLIGGVMWLATSLLSREYFAEHYRNRNRYYFFFLMTLGATVGVFLSADLFTTFIFFEIMSFTSYTWVAHDETPGALRAAETYLAVAVIGGMVMLMGLLLLYRLLGTVRIDELYEAAKACPNKGTLWAASICILLGFGAKAGMFPLHIWLPKAHPVAPAPASALLSGILTKTGIYGIIVVSCEVFRSNPDWGRLVLILGLITMVGGAVLAVFSVNLKRTLACSSMSQIGFILTGIAMTCLLGEEENALAARGALLYMLNHSLFKLILFMAAGVVYMNLHKLDLNDVRGFGRGKPILHFAFLMGALGLMGFPYLSGYVSKTLIHEGIVEYTELLMEEGLSGEAFLYRAAEWVYLFSGGLTGAYMIKLYICLFWEKHPFYQIAYDEKKNYMNLLSTLALGLSALLVPLLGVCPNLTMDRIADFAGGFLHAATPAHPVAYFSLGNLKGACISLSIGLVVYLAVIRPLLMKKNEDGVKEYVNLWPAWLDVEDRLYRPFIDLLFRAGGFAASVGTTDILEERVMKPIVRGAVWFGGRMASFGTAEILEDRIMKPAVRGLELAGTIIARIFGGITDTIAGLISATVLSMRRRHEETEGGVPVLNAVGNMLEGVQQRVTHRRGTQAGALNGISAGVLDALKRITHTMSYGLMLFGLGLCVTLFYLMFYK